MYFLRQDCIKLCTKFGLDQDESSEFFNALEKRLTRIYTQIASESLKMDLKLSTERMSGKDKEIYIKESLMNLDIYASILLNRFNVLLDHEPRDLTSYKQNSEQVPIIRAPIKTAVNFNEETNQHENLVYHVSQILNNLEEFNVDSKTEIQSLLKDNKDQLVQKNIEIQQPLLSLWYNVELQQKINAESKIIDEITDGIFTEYSNNNDVVKIISEMKGTIQADIIEYKAGFNSFKSLPEVFKPTINALQDIASQDNEVLINKVDNVRQVCLRIFNIRRELKKWERKRDSDYAEVKNGRKDINDMVEAKMLIDEMDEEPLSESILRELHQKFPQYTSDTILSETISETVDLIRSRDKLDAVSQLMNLLDITSTKELLDIGPNTVALRLQDKIDKRDELMNQNRLYHLSETLKKRGDDAKEFVDFLIPTIVYLAYVNLYDTEFAHNEVMEGLGFKRVELDELKAMQRFVSEMLGFDFVVNHNEYMEYLNKSTDLRSLAREDAGSPSSINMSSTPSSISISATPNIITSSIATTPNIMTSNSTGRQELVEEENRVSDSGEKKPTPPATSCLNLICAGPVYLIRNVQDSILERFNRFKADASKDNNSKGAVVSESERKYNERKAASSNAPTTFFPKRPKPKV